MSAQPIHRPWSEAEVQRLRAIYEVAGPDHPLDLSRQAVRFFPGRHKANVCRKARSLGLPTNQGRQKKAIQHELHLPANRSEVRRAAIEEHGHPRGFLGKKHTPAALAVISEKSKAQWADPNSALNTEAQRQRRSDAMVGLRNAGHMRGGFHAYSRAHAGRREDLGGLYVRSRWEANYARVLNVLLARGAIREWQYEAKTFLFEKVNRGTRSYTPDFRVEQPDGSIEWHEVKGWMDDKSRVRLDLMAKLYPDEKVIVIGADWFKANARNFSRMIAGWEK
jgi:hypothetical protein